jgi:hypothetical protein
MKNAMPLHARRAVFSLFLFAIASVGLAKTEKQSSASNREKIDELIAAAMKNMSTGVWLVKGTVTFKKTIKLRGLFSGEDFDLTMEPGVKPGVPMRGIVIKDKTWVCSDGETWHAGSPDDRLLYNWAHTPIMAGRQLPPFEKVGDEQRNGQTWQHIRLKAYQAVLAKLRDAASKQSLRETQRAWLASRDAAAARDAEQADGGLIAPTIRYETMTYLTRERTKELQAMLGTKSRSKPEATGAPASPVSTPESSSEPVQSVSETGRTSSSSSSSVSPDKQWEYKCDEYGLGQCAPEIVKAGTTQVILDLDQELGVYNPEANQTKVIWAADSKRFACNYSPVHAHHTTFQSVAFYQLRGDKWVALRSPVDEASEVSQLAQFGKGHLPKDFNPRHCAPERDVLKARNWTDANTAILYAPCYGRTSGELAAGFLFTVKFNDGGDWKIVNTHRMSKKELEQQEQ